MHEQGRDGEGPLGPPERRAGSASLRGFRPVLSLSTSHHTYFRGPPRTGHCSARVPSSGYRGQRAKGGLPPLPHRRRRWLRAFGLRRPRLKDALRGLACSLGAACVILVPGLLFSAFGIENAFLAQAKSGPRASAALLPLFLATSMTTGYCEELFFRSYLLRRLGQAGFRPIWAAIASALLFGLGHGYQGLVGLVSGSLLGLYFAWRWYESKNLHEIAIGHGLFDAAVFAIALYS